MTRPLRVAHVVATSGLAGVESYLLALLTSFDRAEVEPTLFVARPGPLVERLHARGVPVEFGAPSRKLAFGAGGELSRRWRGRFDLIHAHGPRATFWAASAARRAQLPLVLTLHEMRWHSLPPGPKRSLWVWLERRSWRRARAIVVSSEAVRNATIERWPELESGMRVVRGSVPLLLGDADLPQANPMRSERDAVRLVTVGRLMWTKGYERLLDSLRVMRELGLDASLEIVGMGKGEAALRALAARLGIASRVRWFGGPTVDLPQVLSRAHIFVSATRSEAFPLAVLEAMAIGLPIVAPAVGGLPELVVDGVTGSLVAPVPESELPGALAAAVLRLARNPDLAVRMGEAGAKRAREDLGPRSFARRMAGVYHEVLLAR